MGSLTAGEFESNISGAATLATTRFIYDSDDHRLYFDADGSGAGAAILIATLQPSATMTISDIHVI